MSLLTSPPRLRLASLQHVYGVCCQHVFAALSAKRPPRERRADMRCFNSASFSNWQHSGPLEASRGTDGAGAAVGPEALFAVDQLEQLALGLGPIATRPEPQPKEAPTFLTERSLTCVSRCHCETRRDPARKPKCNTTTKCSNTHVTHWYPWDAAAVQEARQTRDHCNPRVALPRTNQWRLPGQRHVKRITLVAEGAPA